MPFYPPYQYMSGEELAALIKSDKQPNRDYIVVDVRDDDYIGGNIKHAINSPFESFEEQVQDLVDQTKQISTVIFHCALSQQRGPKAARMYAEKRNALEEQGKDKSHEVFVLRGGFTEFQLKHRNDPELVENWDKNVWNNPYF